MNLFGKARGTCDIAVADLRAAGYVRDGRPKRRGFVVRGEIVVHPTGQIGAFVGAEPEGKPVIFWISGGGGWYPKYQEVVAEFDRDFNPPPLKDLA